MTAKKHNKNHVLGALFVIIGLVSLTAVVCYAGVVLDLTHAHARDWHNIDLVVNALNHRCGGCIANMTDTGFDAKGRTAKIGLQDAYVQSIMRVKANYLSTMKLAVMIGVAFMYGLSVLVTGLGYYKKVGKGGG
jgi:hypothetical protein